MPEPFNAAFAELVAEHGYELRCQVGYPPSQYAEVIARPRVFGSTTVDMISFSHGVDRSDRERGATLTGWGESRRLTIAALMAALGAIPTGSDDDYLTAAKLIDDATVQRLAPGKSPLQP